MASVWAVGDVHGEAAKLESLLGALPRGDADTTVFLGDFIDRGPDSAAAVRRVLQEHDAAPERTILLWGNHEDLAAEHFRIPGPSGLAYDPYDWFRNGGKHAMASWGVTGIDLFTAPCPDDLRRLFGLLRLFWRSQDPLLGAYVWVHAGVPPGKRPEEGPSHDLVWIREGFLDVEDPSGRVVVHGHTPSREVRVRCDKIGIDTGAVYGGPLTALQLPERRIFQADGRGRVASFDLPG
jgi:serine/threonine protein phosphatase 1